MLPPAQKDYLIGHKAHGDKKSDGLGRPQDYYDPRYEGLNALVMNVGQRHRGGEYGHGHSSESSDNGKARIEMRE